MRWSLIFMLIGIAFLTMNGVFFVWYTFTGDLQRAALTGIAFIIAQNALRDGAA